MRARKFRFEPAWNQYVPDGYEEPLEPLGTGPMEPDLIPATEPPRDLYASLKETFAAMSVGAREAEGPGKCHLHPSGCHCHWCETAAQRTADRLKATALWERYGWG